MKYKCPCCGNFTFDKVPYDTFDICPVCFWEDAGTQIDEPDREEYPNGVSLNQARQNYKDFGACSRDMLPHVRKPQASELNGAEDK